MKTTKDVHPPANAELYAMAERHFNEPVIVGFDVGRVIGYAETDTVLDRDCYIIVAFPNGHYPGDKNVVWCTCVGGYVFLDRLRGQEYVRSTSEEDWDDLHRLDSFLSLNGAPRAEAFSYEVETDTP